MPGQQEQCAPGMHEYRKTHTEVHLLPNATGCIRNNYFRCSKCGNGGYGGWGLEDVNDGGPTAPQLSRTRQSMPWDDVAEPYPKGSVIGPRIDDEMARINLDRALHGEHGAVGQLDAQGHGHPSARFIHGDDPGQPSHQLVRHA